MLTCSECDSRSTARCQASAALLCPARPAIFHRSARSRPAQKAQKHAFVSPLFATLTHSLSRKSFACHSYANTRDGGYPRLHFLFPIRNRGLFSCTYEF